MPPKAIPKDPFSIPAYFGPKPFSFIAWSAKYCSTIAVFPPYFAISAGVKFATLSEISCAIESTLVIFGSIVPELTGLLVPDFILDFTISSHKAFILKRVASATNKISLKPFAFQFAPSIAIDCCSYANLAASIPLSVAFKESSCARSVTF